MKRVCVSYGRGGTGSIWSLQAVLCKKEGQSMMNNTKAEDNADENQDRERGRDREKERAR